MAIVEIQARVGRRRIREQAAAVFAEDWSGYPDSTWGNSTALDGRRIWRQGELFSTDGAAAGWRIESGLAVCGAGSGASVNASNSNIDYRSQWAARLDDDLGSADVYARATFGAVAATPNHFGILARIGSSDTITCYYAQIRIGSGDVRLATVNAGSFGSVLDTVSHTHTEGDTYELRCHGSTISVHINGTEEISVTNTAITTGGQAGLYASTSIGQTVRAALFEAGPLDESGDPVEGAAHPAVPAVQFAWSGMPTATTAPVAASVRNIDAIRLVVADNDTLTSPDYTSDYLEPDDLGLVQFTATGLSAGTAYHYGLQVDDVTVGPLRRFRTPPGSGSFTFAASGDAGSVGSVGPYIRTDRTTNSPTYDRIVDRDPAFFLFSGDRHYRDYNVTALPPHLRALRDVCDNPRAAALFAAMPVAQIWDDHDFTGDSADGSATGRDAAVEVFRRAVPIGGYLVDAAITDPVGHTFTWGRCRFIVLDHRSSRSTGTTFLGTAQRNALLDLLDAATEPLIFLYVGVPWIASSGSDNWNGSGNERADIAEAIETHAKDRLIILHADAHMLAADDGTNSQYADSEDPGPPVWCSAPIDSVTSFKGGPYSEGSVPIEAEAGPQEQQYAVIDVNDQGTQIVVTWTGYDVDGESETDVLTHQVTIAVGGD